MQFDRDHIVTPAADPEDTVLLALYDRQTFAPHMLRGEL
jgi:hypothetical protein